MATGNGIAALLDGAPARGAGAAGAADRRAPEARSNAAFGPQGPTRRTPAAHSAARQHCSRIDKLPVPAESPGDTES